MYPVDLSCNIRVCRILLGSGTPQNFTTSVISLYIRVCTKHFLLYCCIDVIMGCKNDCPYDHPQDNHCLTFIRIYFCEQDIFCTPYIQS